MKKLGLTLAAAMVFSASVFANGQTDSIPTQWNGTINKAKLTKYLKLSAAQNEEVANICDFFEEQMTVANSTKHNKDAKVRNAVYGNLKLMRKTLDDKQYADYLRLMALTLQNKGIDVEKK